MACMEVKNTNFKGNSEREMKGEACFNESKYYNAAGFQVVENSQIFKDKKTTIALALYNQPGIDTIEIKNKSGLEQKISTLEEFKLTDFELNKNGYTAKLESATQIVTIEGQNAYIVIPDFMDSTIERKEDRRVDVNNNIPGYLKKTGLEDHREVHFNAIVMLDTGVDVNDLFKVKDKGNASWCNIWDKAKKKSINLALSYAKEHGAVAGYSIGRDESVYLTPTLDGGNSTLAVKINRHSATGYYVNKIKESSGVAAALVKSIPKWQSLIGYAYDTIVEILPGLEKIDEENSEFKLIQKETLISGKIINRLLGEAVAVNIHQKAENFKHVSVQNDVAAVQQEIETDDEFYDALEQQEKDTEEDDEVYYDAREDATSIFEEFKQSKKRNWFFGMTGKPVAAYEQPNGSWLVVTKGWFGMYGIYDFDHDAKEAYKVRNSTQKLEFVFDNKNKSVDFRIRSLFFTQFTPYSYHENLVKELRVVEEGADQKTYQSTFGDKISEKKERLGYLLDKFKYASRQFGKIATKSNRPEIPKEQQLSIDLGNKPVFSMITKILRWLEDSLKYFFPRYNLFPEVGTGERKIPGTESKVKYFTSEKQKQNTLKVEEGKLYDYDGNLYDTSDKISKGKKGCVAYVITLDGRLVVHQHVNPGNSKHSIRHSTLAGGQPVICSGLMGIKEGKITYIDNNSGHYKPTDAHLYNAVKCLKKLGIYSESTKVVHLGSWSSVLKEFPILYKIPARKEPVGRFLERMGKKGKDGLTQAEKYFEKVKEYYEKYERKAFVPLRLETAMRHLKSYESPTSLEVVIRCNNVIILPSYLEFMGKFNRRSEIRKITIEHAIRRVIGANYGHKPEVNCQDNNVVITFKKSEDASKFITLLQVKGHDYGNEENTITMGIDQACRFISNVLKINMDQKEVLSTLKSVEVSSPCRNVAVGD
ncbi:MAG: hypothetical protein QWI36_00020 [Wolbachia endosymbiont of Tyrophagus putrescentiae]|nr:hypothetical protein [Wolbachia endosymbiont of Tyrophagus putrescentiae]